MAGKTILAAIGVACAAVVHFLFDGNYALTGAALVVGIWMTRLIHFAPVVDDGYHLPATIDRLIVPFSYLSTLDINDAELVGTYIYEELDLDARSELSDHILSALVETQQIAPSLANRIRGFRVRAISKIDERLAVVDIPGDVAWCKLIEESQLILRELQCVAG